MFFQSTSYWLFFILFAIPLPSQGQGISVEPFLAKESQEIAVVAPCCMITAMDADETYVARFSCSRSTPKDFQLYISLSIVRDEQILRWNGMKNVAQSSRETVAG